ncbi:phosphoenolpyruvate carboxylase [Shigella flexneri]
MARRTDYLRELNEQLEENLGYELPVEFVPVRFTSWMGGDRDGNRTSLPISPATSCCSAVGKPPICS